MKGQTFAVSVLCTTRVTLLKPGVSTAVEVKTAVELTYLVGCGGVLSLYTVVWWPEIDIVGKL